ncbi:MAG: right-handed parallel beta-helix repeat-containing protein [Phenylobacterium sp.]|nr:right-handed parallel beta-helix repeat-containing protein [Phenylobacterium sp.]
MATILVKDSAGLTAALGSAKSGDVIKLMPGDYEAVTVSGLSFADKGVTVTSFDPANEAKLQGLTVKDSGGLTFSNLEFLANPEKSNSFQVLDSSRVTFEGLNVHGSLDGNPQNDTNGLMIRRSSDVTVRDSDFEDLEFGISHRDSNNILIDGNKFNNIQTDGVRGGGTSHITVSNNYFTNFYPKEKDHPDAIQFWTTHTTTSATDIVVTGNVFVRGEGEAIQGIFFRDQVGDLPYKNVLISDNLVVGGVINGIKVNGADGLIISNNVVGSLPDQKSAIGLEYVTNVQLTNNASSHYSIDDTVSNLTEVGSKVIATAADGGRSLVDAFFGNDLNVGVSQHHDVAKAGTTEALMTIEASRKDTVTVSGGSGADRLSVDAKRDTLIEAGAGDDMITGGGVGHNTLIGGGGDDTYRVHSIYDTVVEEAGGGNDLVVAYVDYELTENVERLNLVGDGLFGKGNALDNTISGSDGNDVISGLGGNDVIKAVNGDDRVHGGTGNDTVYGGAGADTINGGDGDDRIRGDEGDDSLAGGAGDDLLIGGAGADLFSGGAGADVFQLGDGDVGKGETIFDFNRAEGDKISLQPIDANTLISGNQAFKFVGQAAFSKTAGELRYDLTDGDAYVMGDANGDGIADFTLLVKGVGAMQSGDFIL